MKQGLWTAILCLFTHLSNAQLFAPLTNSPLTSTPGDSRSVNIIDFNNDGLEDIYITNGLQGGQNNELYLNLGNGQFVPITNDPMVQDNSPSDGATCADTDNDGDLDCFMVTWYGKRNYYYVNSGDTSFQHLPDAITGSLGTYSETAAFADYNRDGRVDIYITNSEGDKRNLLYRNDGNHVFTKITAPWLNENKLSRAAVWADYDNDGDPDLYVANENQTTNQLFRNDGTDSFFKITNDPSVQEAQSSMTASWGDVNNDGWQDLFVGNAGYFQAQTNRLFLNNGVGGFTAAAAGPISTDASCSYGSAFADYDNDGDLDLWVSNGFCNPPVLNYLYQNDGTGHFTRDLTALSDFTTPCSFGAAWGDLDNNGFPDLVVSTCKNTSAAPLPNNMVWMNQGNGHHWLKIQLAGTVSNRSAIGAQIRLFATINGQNTVQLREISAQTGYCGQNSLIAHFGLGTTTQADSVQVWWPSGMKQTFHNLPSDAQILLTENNSSVGAAAWNTVPFRLTVAPNPVEDTLRFTLESETVLMPVAYTLSHPDGRVFRTESAAQLPAGRTTVEWSTANLSPGMYWLTVETSAGKRVVTVVRNQ